ncbi:hypothetical protein SAMN02910275_02687 [Butyrivibrio sp. INlla18]|uniref:hypothetical protein n=1 Tax=Butyrivibrio sp. INlla18 TaxID=1520806 RepID=UPI000883CF3C|nr:hypothetical protein [Butyrivibrio sp. INlla18]SDA75972.1 hypothetical protein SAMN02910275_02687 [Butyrivibrio sp. INlla18]
MRKVRTVGKKILALISAVVVVATMIVPGKMVKAADLGELQNGGSTQLSVGDTVTLKCSSNYAYNGRTVEWSMDQEGIVEITDTDDGDSYSSITSADIKAVAAGKVTVTMHAEDYWGWYKDDEVFEIEVVSDDQEDPEQPEEPTEPTNPSEPTEPETPVESDKAELKVSDVSLSGGAIVISFNCTGDELYSVVQAGLKVTVGEKEIFYEPNYSYYGNNNVGTYIKSGNGIYFYPSDFAEGENVVTLVAADQTIKLGVKKTTTDQGWFGNTYEIETFDVKEDSEGGNEETPVIKTLYIRLVGAFESKMVGEEDIDAVSSATTVSYMPEQTNSVKLQAALVENVEKAEDVSESDWHELSFYNKEEGAIKVNEDPTKTKIVIEPDCEGITAGYNIFTGDVVLQGTPKKEGTYKVYVVFTDNEGRTATSNSVDFKVNSQHEKLADKLTLENCTKTADGKYIYDQDPWYLEEFGEDTVVVPKEIKAWFGSHTMGTYSEVGEIISLTNGDEPKQTLIVPDGCDLTLVNVRVHSGVKIIVQGGGKLTIRQSTLEGIVEVENGGTFSSDYSGYGGKGSFIYGSTVNGQIRLKDGATIENARIISKTNYSVRDDMNRRNQEPVVVVDGNVNVKGDVYILASEAPNGSYGQSGLKVNGTLNIPAGSSVAVYGGGESHLTAKGGDAVVMNGGLIQGDGNLIAVGGFGMNITGDRSLLGGGAAISGNGSVDVKNVYVEGGSSFDTVNKTVQGNVLVSTRSDVTMVSGKATGETSDKYWHGTGDESTIPVVSAYFDEGKLSAPEVKENTNKTENTEKKDASQNKSSDTSNDTSNKADGSGNSESTERSDSSNSDNGHSNTIGNNVTTPTNTAKASVLGENRGENIAQVAKNDMASNKTIHTTSAKAPAIDTSDKSEEKVDDASDNDNSVEKKETVETSDKEITESETPLADAVVTPADDAKNFPIVATLVAVAILVIFFVGANTLLRKQVMKKH